MIICALLTSLLSISLALAGETRVESLSNFISNALDNNPELKASDARWQMFSDRVDQARTFDDPMLTVKIQNGVVSDPFNFGKEPMTAKAIGISQKVPFWGKRDLKAEVAAKEADSYRWLWAERKVVLVRMVKEVWFHLFYIDKSTAIVGKNIRILERFIKLAETRYSVSKGSQTDILKAQLGRSRLLDMQITLHQQRRTAQATLNSLLYRPAETPVGTIPEFNVTPLTVSDKDLLEIAYSNRPMIKGLIAEMAKSNAKHGLAEKEFYPDFTFFLEYMQRDPVTGGVGNDLYTLGVTFNLPVWQARRHAAVAESDAELTMVSEELSTLKNDISFGVSDQLAQLHKRHDLIALYKTGIIPQAEQTLQSATINYRVNKVDFLTLLDSQTSLLNYEREYYESLADYEMKLAQLEALVGKELAHDGG